MRIIRRFASKFRLVKPSLLAIGVLQTHAPERDLPAGLDRRIRDFGI